VHLLVCELRDSENLSENHETVPQRFETCKCFRPRGCIFFKTLDVGKMQKVASSYRAQTCTVLIPNVACSLP